MTDRCRLKAGLDELLMQPLHVIDIDVGRPVRVDPERSAQELQGNRDIAALGDGKDNIRGAFLFPADAGKTHALVVSDGLIHVADLDHGHGA